MARTIEDAYQKAMVLEAIAEVYAAEAGKHDQVIRTLSEALEVARTIVDDSKKAYALLEISQEYSLPSTVYCKPGHQGRSQGCAAGRTPNAGAQALLYAIGTDMLRRAMGGR